MLLLHGTMLTAPLALWVVHTRFKVDALGTCLFKAVAGVDCPACGITRSASAMFRGHMGEAFRLHPAGPLVVGIIGITAVYLTLALATEHAGFEWKKELKMFKSLELLAVGALLIVWLVKLFGN
jgi:hypothetical protein